MEEQNDLSVSEKQQATNNQETDSNQSSSSQFLFINIKQENVEQGWYGEEEPEEAIASTEAPDNSSTNQSEMENNNGSEESYKSSECLLGINNEADLNPTNLIENVDTIVDSNSENNQAFVCSRCLLSFISPAYLERHKNRCRSSFKVNAEGSLKDVNNTTMETDVEKKHNHKCDTCGKGFVQKRYLKEHEAIHKTEQLFQCSECPYSNHLLRNLKLHLAKHNRKEKIYACSQCNYTTSKSHYLRNHMFKHSDEKPYSCDRCSYSTALKANLTSHMTSHDGQKPYACSHCYYSTARKLQLAKHLEKFHRDKANADS